MGFEEMSVLSQNKAEELDPNKFTEWFRSQGFEVDPSNTDTYLEAFDAIKKTEGPSVAYTPENLPFENAPRGLEDFIESLRVGTKVESEVKETVTQEQLNEYAEWFKAQGPEFSFVSGDNNYSLKQALSMLEEQAKNTSSYDPEFNPFHEAPFLMEGNIKSL